MPSTLRGSFKILNLNGSLEKNSVAPLDDDIAWRKKCWLRRCPLRACSAEA
jgi:hypothetical protein